MAPYPILKSDAIVLSWKAMLIKKLGDDSFSWEMATRWKGPSININKA